MTKINAQIIADSKNEFGNRITTMVVTFPRYILAELNTHRMLSKNSASSRAIPFEKLLKSVEENPFIPIAWMKDHKGMQGTEYFSGKDTIQESLGKHTPFDKYFTNKWLSARDNAVDTAFHLSNQGLTKQLVNRLLEPFMWHTVIITATEWENFFALRCPKYTINIEKTPRIFRSRRDVIKIFNKQDDMNDEYWRAINAGQADIHMMALAEAMWDAYNESTPKELKAGEWHIPFGDNMKGVEDFLCDLHGNEFGDEFEYKHFQERGKIKIATARCARISYTVVGEEGKEANYENDIKLHDRLAESGHWSPFEHCAKVMTSDEYGEWHIPMKDGMSGNFKGFIQYRKMFDNENIK